MWLAWNNVQVEKLTGYRFFVAGVGQCASLSLKARKRANPCVFTVNLTARGRES